MRPTLKNWGFDGCGLVGEVYGHPDKPDGLCIATSNLLELRRDGDLLIAACTSREYLLEDIDSRYETLYPDAINRLLARFEHKR